MTTGTGLLIGIVGELERMKSIWMNWRYEWMQWQQWIMNARMTEWMTQRMNEWVSEWMNERMNEWMNQWFLPILSSKSALALRVFLILCETELSLQSCAHFVDHFPDRGAKFGETATILRRPRRPRRPQKAHSFVLESSFKPGFTHSRTVTLPNYLMMMWLTWWCAGHDDVVDMIATMLAINIVHNWDVF